MSQRNGNSYGQSAPSSTSMPVAESASPDAFGAGSASQEPSMNPESVPASIEDESSAYSQDIPF